MLNSGIHFFARILEAVNASLTIRGGGKRLGGCDTSGESQRKERGGASFFHSDAVKEVDCAVELHANLKLVVVASSRPLKNKSTKAVSLHFLTTDWRRLMD